MRKLQGKDIFTMARIIKKAQLKEMLKQAIEESKEVKDVGKFGMDIVFNVIECAGNAGVEDEVWAWLDDILEVADTKAMDLFELLDLVKQLVEINDMKRFFNAAGQLNQ